MLTTERLLLRQWTAADREPFAAMGADPAVMAHFPSVFDRSQSDAMADRLEAGIAQRGWGFWAVEVRATGEFAGYVGLGPLKDSLSFAPGVEIGWRLATAHWGLGYASEAARRALAYGFDELGLAEIVAFTTRQNTPSQRVMERLGMVHDPDEDFDHPDTPTGWAERRHVLYRLRRPLSP